MKNIILMEDRFQRRVGIWTKMLPNESLSITTGQQAGLPGAALRQPGNAESCIDRCQRHASTGALRIAEMGDVVLHNVPEYVPLRREKRIILPVLLPDAYPVEKNQQDVCRAARHARYFEEGANASAHAFSMTFIFSPNADSNT